jgi:ABC-type antimicrobial peptide transport system permease subunit
LAAPRRRIISQVMGESLVVGIMGGAVGILLGLGGAALISARAPVLSAVVPASGSTSAPGSGLFQGGHQVGVTAPHTVSVVLTAPVSLIILGVAIGLALAGGIIAGSFGGWRIARLRPAAALARVE